MNRSLHLSLQRCLRLGISSLASLFFAFGGSCPSANFTFKVGGLLPTLNIFFAVGGSFPAAILSFSFPLLDAPASNDPTVAFALVDGPAGFPPTGSQSFFRWIGGLGFLTPEDFSRDMVLPVRRALPSILMPPLLEKSRFTWNLRSHGIPRIAS